MPRHSYALQADGVKHGISFSTNIKTIAAQESFADLQDRLVGLAEITERISLERKNIMVRDEVRWLGLLVAASFVHHYSSSIPGTEKYHRAVERDAQTFCAGGTTGPSGHHVLKICGGINCRMTCTGCVYFSRLSKGLRFL